MRLMPTVLLGVVLVAGCNADRVTGVTQVDHQSAATVKRLHVALTISAELPGGRDLREGDTVAVTARVVDSVGADVATPDIEWHGGVVVDRKSDV